MIFVMVAMMRLLLCGTGPLVLENAALRQQLVVLQRSGPRPRLKPKDRRF